MGKCRATQPVAHLVGESNSGHALAGCVSRVISQCASEREIANHDMDGRGWTKLAGINLRLGNGDLEPEPPALEGLAGNDHFVIIIAAE